MLRKLNKMFLLLRQFGFLFSIRYCMYKILNEDDKYIELVCTYLKHDLTSLIDKYKSTSVESTLIRNNDKIPVWVCWFQGENQMPDLCKLNYQRLKEVLPENAVLHLITLDNYKKYVDIPNYVLEKVDAGKISLTHLSDILRWSLLSKWGGFWIDSTIYCSKKIDKEFLSSTNFWTIKLDEVHSSNYIGQLISGCKWSGFILKDNSNSNLIRFVLESTLKYWENHDIVIDYFMQNFIIKIAYDNIETIMKEIDNVGISNNNVYDLHLIMDEVYDAERYENLSKETTFFKLTWKKPYLKKDSNGTNTYYGSLVSIGDME